MAEYHPKIGLDLGGKDFAKSLERTMKSYAEMGKAFQKAGVQMAEALSRIGEAMPRHELEEDDFSIMPDVALSELGTYIVYRDAEDTDLFSRVYFVEEGEDPWIHVDYLVGDDLDPVTILKLSIFETHDGYEVLAYRRADRKGNVYQDGWVGENVPDEYATAEEPRKTAIFKRRLQVIEFEEEE